MTDIMNIHNKCYELNDQVKEIDEKLRLEEDADIRSQLIDESTRLWRCIVHEQSRIERYLARYET